MVDTDSHWHFRLRCVFVHFNDVWIWSQIIYRWRLYLWYYLRTADVSHVKHSSQTVHVWNRRYASEAFENKASNEWWVSACKLTESSHTHQNTNTLFICYIFVQFDSKEHIFCAWIKHQIICLCCLMWKLPCDEIQKQHSINMLREILFEYIAIIYFGQNVQLSNWS